MLTDDVSRVVYEGTDEKRCDHCCHWKPLSGARVMGWCEVERKMPDHVPPLMLLIGRLSDDQVTAYNQLCQAYDKENPNAE